MNKLVTLLIICPFVLIGQNSYLKEINLLYDFNILQMYLVPNNSFILKTHKHNNFSSRIEGNFIFSAGGFGKTQFESELRYTTTFSKPNETSMSIRQMYVEIPLTDFSFLTVGKKRKNFGSAIFHGFSNRLSPKEIFVDRTERTIPGLIEYSWIASQHIAFESIIWFTNVQNCEDINLSQGIEITLDRFYGDVHLYYENQKRWLVGLNLSYNLNTLLFYNESIIKENSDQFIVKDDSLVQRVGNFYSLSTGLSWQKNRYSLSIEYAFRSEGFTDNEKESYHSFISAYNNGYQYYTLNYYTKQYLSLSLSMFNFLTTNLSLNFSNIYALDDDSGYLTGGLGYFFKDVASFGFYIRYHYGNDSSEYILLTPNKQYVFATISLSF